MRRLHRMAVPRATITLLGVAPATAGTIASNTRGMPANAAPDIRFIPCPTITAGLADSEEAPTESIPIPRGSADQADASEDLTTLAMKGFQKFMVKPDRIDNVLSIIERARKRIYASN